MKKIILLFFLSVHMLSLAQIDGDWYGDIKLPNASLPFQLHIVNDNNALTATADSPKQMAYGLPIDKIWLNGDSLFFENKTIRFHYKGKYDAEKQLINGLFIQNNMPFELNFNRQIKKLERPQTPTPPYSYQSQNITIPTKDNALIAGTLTMPSTTQKWPLVILVAGSGPNDRDETLFDHKPFLVIADYLTKQGYAVFRYDKRGVNESTGNFETATVDDFYDDLTNVYQFFEKQNYIDTKQITILGHSEGGILASKLAAKFKKVKSIILMASPALNGDELLVLQNDKIAEAMGLDKMQRLINKNLNKETYKIINENADINERKKALITLLEKTNTIDKNDIDDVVASITNPYIRSLLMVTPEKDLKRIQQKVLVLQGEKDLQVPSDENISAFKKHLNSSNTVYKIYPNLNHLFQPSEKGLPQEYSEITTTIAPEVLEDMVKFLNQQ